MPLLRLLSAFLLCALLGACGDTSGTRPGARVRILTSEADGPVEGIVLLESTSDEQAKVYEAHPLDSDPDVYVAQDAPPGTYYVRSSAGWGMLWAGTGGSRAPLLRDGSRPATTVRLGRPLTLYVGAADPRTVHGHVGEAWAAEWKKGGSGDDVTFEPVDIEIVPQGEGLMALRFPADVWRPGHVIRAGGVFESGVVTQLISFVKGAEKSDLPRIAFTSAAPVAPLNVWFVAPPVVGVVPDGLRVKVTLRDVPLRAAYWEKSFKGAARFEGIGSVGHGIQVAAPSLGAQAVFELGQEAWRAQGELHLLMLDESTRRRVSLSAGAQEIEELRVLLAGSNIYGRVPLWRSGDQTYVVVLPGTQRWQARRADGRWIEQEVVVSESSGTPMALTAEARESARVRGSVVGGGRGFRVQFTLLAESGSRVTGAGLSANVDPYRQFDIRVPAGRYELQVIRPGGSGARPQVLSLPPGREAHIDLPAR